MELMGHQDMCMPWREMLAGKVTTTTLRSRIIQLNLPKTIKNSREIWVPLNQAIE